MGSVTFQLILLVFYVLLSNIFFQKPVDPYYYEKNLRPHRVVALIMYFPRDSVTKQRHGIPRVKCISLNVGGIAFATFPEVSFPQNGFLSDYVVRGCSKYIYLKSLEDF